MERARPASLFVVVLEVPRQAPHLPVVPTVPYHRLAIVRWSIVFRIGEMFAHFVHQVSLWVLDLVHRSHVERESRQVLFPINSYSRMQR